MTKIRTITKHILKYKHKDRAFIDGLLVQQSRILYSDMIEQSDWSEEDLYEGGFYVTYSKKRAKETSKILKALGIPHAIVKEVVMNDKYTSS